MARQPTWVQPTLSTLTRTNFSDPRWVCGPKLDGIRALAFTRGPDVKACEVVRG